MAAQALLAEEGIKISSEEIEAEVKRVSEVTAMLCKALCAQQHEEASDALCSCSLICPWWLQASLQFNEWGQEFDPVMLREQVLESLQVCPQYICIARVLSDLVLADPSLADAG